MSGTTYTINADGNFITKMDRMADSVNKLNAKLANTADKGKRAKDNLDFDTDSIDKYGTAITGIAAKFAAAAASGAAFIALMKQADSIADDAAAKNRTASEWWGQIGQQAKGEELRKMYALDRKYSPGFESRAQSAGTIYGLYGAQSMELLPIIAAMKSTNTISDPMALGPAIKAVKSNQQEGLTGAEVYSTFMEAGKINTRNPIPAMTFAGKYVSEGTNLPGVKVAELATMGAIISSGKTSTESGAEAATALMIELQNQGAGTKQSMSLLERLQSAKPDSKVSVKDNDRPRAN